MSCTENDSGPFVVFFLPALVGCLTILLARRWANSQVTSTTSTGISRRRKIIKDPLAKRPLPPLTCKMVAPGSKKSTGVNKKGAYPSTEEDVNGKRTGRSSHSATATQPDLKYIDGPIPPKHIPFPNLAQDSPLLFEAMTFVFTVVAAGLQFLNLYRTAWWLPHSPTNQAMNFYLIDPHLVVFILTIMMPRFLLVSSVTVLKMFVSAKMMPYATKAARMLIFGIIVSVLGSCIYFIMMKYSAMKIFYLCYPAVIYFVLFGFKLSPFLELHTLETPLIHVCSHDPEHIRNEVDMFRRDFNLRLKKMLFNSIVGAYYTSFIPCCFAQSYLYYDVYSSSQQVAFVWGGLFGRYASQLLCATYCDLPHRAALHLGKWHPDTICSDSYEVTPWLPNKLWGKNSLVIHKGVVYSTDYPVIAAEPGMAQYMRFHTAFIRPARLLCLLLCLQLALIVLQLCLLFSSAAWHFFFSIVILLFINYYTLFKLVRDYLVTWNVYKAEILIQDKNFVVPEK